MRQLFGLITIALCVSFNSFSQTRIQSATGNTGTSATKSFSVNLSSTPGNYNTLIAVISTRSTLVKSITGISQTGATWVRADYSRGTSGSTTEIWYTTVLNSAAKLITINQSAVQSAAVIVEYSGLVYGAPLDVFANNAASTGTNLSTGTTTVTTQSNELWVAGLGLRSSSYTISGITNSFISVANAASTSGTSSNNAKIYALEKMVNSTSTASTSAIASNSSYWSGAIATFKVTDITGFSPTSVCSGGGAQVTVSGQGFVSDAIVYFNGVAATTSFVNSSQLTATVPVSATSGFITVLNNGITLTAKTPFLIKSPESPTAVITNTTCPFSADGAVRPDNIPVAINFDNTKSQYINLGSSLLNNLPAFTLEGWIKPTANSRNSFFGQNNAIEIGFASDGTIELWSEGIYTNIYSPSAYPNDGLWHHIAGTGDGTSMKIYVDGVLVKSGTHSATSNYGSSAYNAMIGGYVWDAVTSNYFNGQMLKVGFWNRALSNVEIAQLAATPHHYYAGDSGLIAGYNFYEGTGTALNRIPTGTAGTLTGTITSTWTDLFTYSWTKSGGGFGASTKNISTLTTGTYNLTATFNGCSASSSDFIVTSDGVESIAPTSVSGTSPICQNSSSQLTVNGGSLGTGAEWKWYSGSCGGVLVDSGSTITVNPVVTTTYYVRAEGSCNITDCASYTVVVNSTGTWLGTINTDWNTDDNWCGNVPSSGTDVIIPASAPNQPIIGDLDAVCNSISIQSGASLTIQNANTLTVHGNWQNNGTFTPNSGNVIFNGSTTISGSSTTDYYDLTINSTKTLTSHPVSVNIKHDWINNGTFLHNSGTVNFNGTAQQDISGETTFHNLTINNASGVLAEDNITVNAVLNLASENASSTVGALDMKPVYTGDVLSSSNTLYMGAHATTIGVGDVTGRIVRDTIAADVEYTFGNANTSIRFYDGASLPTQLKIIPRIGICHATKSNTLQRTYQIVRTGGSTPTKFSLKLSYLTSELNGANENNLVFWDHHIPYATTSPHEHGKTELNTSGNTITLSGHGIRYLAQNEYFGELAYVDDITTPPSQAKIWMISSKESTSNFVWLGAATTGWDNVSNWNGSTIPTTTSDVIIPADAARWPIVPADSLRKVRSIEIQQGATVNMGTNATLEIYGSLADNNGTVSWNNSGTFVPGTSTVVFKRNNAAISGNTQFNNLTVATDSTLNILNGGTVSVSGSFTNGGVLNAMYNGPTSFVYNGGDQTVQASDESHYYHLTFSGTGTKTIQNANLNVAGDIALNTEFSAGSSTLVLNGTSVQTLSGNSSSLLNNVSINNVNGLLLSKNQSIDGTLTLTNGLITTGNNSLTLTCNASTSGQSSQSYVNGKLARQYCTATSYLFPIGKGGVYRPLTLAYTTLTESETSTLQAEQFETEIAGSIPANTSYQNARYWNVSEVDGNANGNYTLTLNGSTFTPAATAKILRGNGTSNSLIAATYSSPDFTSETITDNVFGNFTVASECVPPMINTQPTSTNTCELNGTPQFSVDASGADNYQWQFSAGGVEGSFSDITNGGVYSNATTSALTITNPAYAMNGYAYRVIVSRSCGGSTTSNADTLTVYPQPQGTLSGQTNICKGETAYLTWTASAGSGPFSIVYNAGAGNQIVNNVSSGVSFEVGTISSNTTFSLVSVSDMHCTRSTGFTTASADITINPFITWTGATNTDWHTATNWCGGVPTVNDDVIIPASATNQPVISTAIANTRSIIVENGASVVVDDGNYSLNVQGNITNSGTINLGTGRLTIAESTVIENNGLIETQNTDSQPLPASTTYGNGGSIRFNGNSAPQNLVAGTYNNIYIENAYGVVLPAGAEVKANGYLQIAANAALEIGTGRSVTVKRLINNAGDSGIRLRSSSDTPSGTLIFDNSETEVVNASVEMYSKSSWNLNQAVNAKYKWQFIGIPVQSMPVLPTFYGGYVRRYNEAGIGAGTTEDKRWIQLQNTSTMEAIEGYEIVMPSERMFEFTGALYNQDISKVLNYTMGAEYPGQHVIGNPYTAAIDIKQIQLGANMDSTIYLYNTGTFKSWEMYKDSTSPDGTTAGQYTAIPINTAGTASIPGQIPSMQAFVVRTKSAAEGSIFINYDAVKQKNTTIQRAPKKNNLAWMRINLRGATMDHDVMWIFSQPGTTFGFDNGWDGLKLAGDAGTARIQSVVDSKNYQINTVPDIHNMSISARAGANDKQYLLKVSNENMAMYYQKIYLLDLETDSVIDITESGTEYYFTMTNTSSVLRFKVLTQLDQTTAAKQVERFLMATYSDSKLIVRNRTGRAGVAKLLNLQGVEVMSAEFSDAPVTSFGQYLNPGVYIYQLQCADGQLVKSKIIVE